MSDSIIKVEGLGKRYIITHEQTGNYTALRDVISKKAKGLLKNKNALPAKEEFWALKDINFEIKKGDAVGIIGRNGAGKSTLLKILSRITEPSTGRIEMNGRVASLLEVGTGFHPELTGRENIFLNGAILGMTRVEIRNKFDEIVDFSGVEKFLDTPVKRYSSGMYVRLAFAVAAHLEPEILVVDEVLAVGDAEFQKKCLGKMSTVNKEDGRTVIFVSHDMSAIEKLCKTAVILEKGSVKDYGESSLVISKYLSQMRNSTQKNFKISDEVIIQSIHLPNSEIFSGDKLEFSINIIFATSRPLISDLCLLIYSEKGVRIGVVDLRNYFDRFEYSSNEIRFTGQISQLNLIEGEYSIGLFCNINMLSKDVMDITSFRVKKANNSEAGISVYETKYRGFVEFKIKS